MVIPFNHIGHVTVHTVLYDVGNIWSNTRNEESAIEKRRTVIKGANCQEVMAMEVDEAIWKL